MIEHNRSTILVTGATGTVGREVIKQLLCATTESNIKAAGRSIEKVKGVINSDRVEPVQIDYDRPDTVKAALKDVDRIFLLTHWQSNLAEVESNLLKEIMNANNIKHIVK